MKNNYSIVQRNALVEDHLWCINSFMEKNRKLVKATGMEHDDVFQQLALRLIKAVAGYDPDKGALLKYELLNCKSAYRLCGITDAPKEFRKGNIISLDSITGDSEMCEQTKVA